MNELYPTCVRLVGIGFVEVSGGVVLMLASQFISLCINNHFSIMIVFAILAGVGLLCSIGLPETKGRVIPDEIAELVEAKNSDNYSQVTS